ncbi:MAG: Mfa1 family fimbria major subunit [Bacteroides sp.]|nr:Mfa1 family fimbria major subunit [Bacteroides sp.]
MKLNRLFLLAAMGLGLFACNDNDLVEGSAPNGTQEEGTTYVGFTIDFGENKTRVTKDATAEESKINTAYVILADGNTISQVVSKPDESGKYVLQTTPGSHDFYVVVNPKTAPTTANTVDEYFNSGVEIEASEFADITTPSFLMASEAKNTFDIAEGITEDQAIAGTDYTTNSFTINVERVAAKVTMTCEDPVLTDKNGSEAGGTISDMAFNLHGGAGKAYRMRQNPFAEIAGNTWSYSVENKEVATSLEDITLNDNVAYCLENIHDAATEYKTGNTTYLTLYTKFQPTNVVDCADEIKALKSNTQPAGSSFYVVKEGEFAGNYIMKADLEDYQDGDPDKMPEGVNVLSEEYVGGVCWFGPIWIGQTATDLDNAPVARNTWYNLKISGITLPGEPEEPTITDPGQPLNPPTYVAITLSVMPWNFIDREIDLQ